MTGSAKQSSYPRRDGLHRRFAPRNDGLNILAKFELGAYDRFDRSNTRVRLLAGLSPISRSLAPITAANPSTASASARPPPRFPSREVVSHTALRNAVCVPPPVRGTE